MYPLKEDNLSTKDRMLGLNGVHYFEVPLSVSFAWQFYRLAVLRELERYVDM